MGGEWRVRTGLALPQSNRKLVADESQRRVKSGGRLVKRARYCQLKVCRFRKQKENLG